MRLPAVALVLAVLVPALLGCGSGASGTVATQPGTVVTFTSADGVELSGRLFGTPTPGGAGMVLAHMYPADQSSWYAYAQELAAKGYQALT